MNLYKIFYAVNYEVHIVATSYSKAEDIWNSYDYKGKIEKIELVEYNISIQKLNE